MNLRNATVIFLSFIGLILVADLDAKSHETVETFTYSHTTLTNSEVHSKVMVLENGSLLFEDDSSSVVYKISNLN